MADLNALAVTQKIKWADRSAIHTTSNGTIVFEDSAGTGFGGGVDFAGISRIRPFQTGSDYPTTASHFPRSGDWGLFYNSTTSRLAMYYNNAGTLQEVQLSDYVYNPLSYYQASDGDAHNLMFQRCMDAMAAPDGTRQLKMVVPFGRYFFQNSVDMPQTADADVSKMRACFEFYGASIENAGFAGPLFRRTTGTPTPNSLFYTIRGGRFVCGATFDEATGSYYTLDADLDTNPFGVTPQTTYSAFKLSNCDGLRFHEALVEDGVAIHLIGTKDVLIQDSILRGGTAVHMESDGSGRNCARGLISQVRANTFGTFGVNFWLEETDSVNLDKCITEQGRPKAFVAWICNDRTDCLQLVVKDTWYENHAPIATGSDRSPRDGVLFVQNKAANAQLHVDGFNFFGSQLSFLRYVNADGANLVVVTDSFSSTHNTNNWGQNAVGSQTTASTNSQPWDSATAYIRGDGAIKAMPVTTPAGHAPNMSYLAIAANTNVEPAPQWHPNLSGGTSDYYPLGTRVYDAGYIYESRVAEPATRPTSQTTTADWEYVEVSPWLPTGQVSIYASTANSHVDCVGGNPKQSGTGRLSVMLYGLDGLPPLRDQTSAFFDNYTVPAGYYAEGSTLVSPQYREIWQVVNGTKVTA